MTTSKKIITNKLTHNNNKLSRTLIEYNENDAVTLGAGMGMSIDIVKSSVAKSSGVKHVIFPSLLNNDYQSLITGSNSTESLLKLESKASQGISIKNFGDTIGDHIPYVYIGDMSPYPNHSSERFAPFLKFSELGVIENIKKEDTFLVYNDTISEYDHKNYINKPQNERGSIYPIISGSRYSSIFEINSTIEPLEIRSQLFKTTVGNTLKNSEDNKYRNFFSGITVDIVGPHVMRKHGSNIMITDVINPFEAPFANNSPYDDNNQKSNKIKQLQPLNYDGNYEYIYKPYDEKKSETYLDNKYDFASGNSSINDLVYGSNIQPPYSKMSEIGTRYESATAGFIYESTTIGSTTLGTDSIAFGGLKGDSSSVTSGIESDTKRRKIKQIDKQGGHYPTIARTGDFTRKGNFNIRFDDRNTIVFNETVTNLEYPQLKPFAGSHPLFSESGYATPNNNTGAITTTGKMISGITDNITLTGDRYLIDLNYNKDLAVNGEVNNDNITSRPFDESRVSLDTSVFYMTGTAEDIYPGFNSRLHDKTQICLSMPNTREEFITRSPKNRNNILDPSGEFFNKEKTGFAYYNWDLKRWEQVGLIDPGTGQQIHHDWAVEINGVGSTKPFISGTNNFPNQFYTCERQQNDTTKPGAIAEAAWKSSGMPHINSFAPQATKYYATSSQTLSMSDYINHPFLLEKIVVEFPFVQRRSHLGAAASNDSAFSYGQILHQSDYVMFFYRQDNKKIARNTRGISKIISSSNRYLIASGCMSFYNNKVYNFTQTSHDTDFIPQNSPAFSLNHQITSTGNTTVSIVTGSATLEITPAIVAMQGLGGIRYPSSSIGDGDAEQAVNPTLWPGGTTYRGFGETKYTGREFRAGVYGGKSNGAHNRLFDNMSNSDRTINFDLLSPCVEFDSRARRISASTEKFNESEIESSKGGQVNVVEVGEKAAVSPYILFPEDELIIGIDNPVSLSDRIASSDFSNEVTGSFLKIENNTSVKITLYGSQIKNKKEFHDTLNQNLTTLGVHEAIHYDNPVLDQFLIAAEAEYSGSYMDTHVTGGVGSITKSIITSGENVLSASIQRFRVFNNKQQRFFDTVLPDLEKMFVIDGVVPVTLEALGAAGDPRIKIAGVNSSVASAVHNFWHKIFPFEPRYSNVSRKISQFFMFFNVDATASSTGATGVRAPFSFLSQDNVVSADLLERIKNTKIAAFSFGAGPSGSFIAQGASTRLNQPVGLKYGMLNYNPQFTKNIYRGDKFGQSADMLEQSLDSRFLVGSSFTSDGPLKIRFVADDDEDDQYVLLDETEILLNTAESSNVSIYATSSLPFFDDDIARNRSYSNIVFTNRIIDIIGFDN